MPATLCPPCSTDLTDGVRATARTLASAEQGIRQAGHAAGRALSETVLPQTQGGCSRRLARGSGVLCPDAPALVLTISF